MSSFALKNGGREEAAAEDRAVTVAPRVDVLETENEFLLIADLPGVKPGDVDLRFDNGELTVHGCRPAGHAGRGVAHREHPATDFQRTFAVTDSVAADRIAAELKDGVLTVRLPKIEAVKPKKITVQG